MADGCLFCGTPVQTVYFWVGGNCLSLSVTMNCSKLRGPVLGITEARRRVAQKRMLLTAWWLPLTFVSGLGFVYMCRNIFPKVGVFVVSPQPTGGWERGDWFGHLR